MSTNLHIPPIEKVYEKWVKDTAISQNFTFCHNQVSKEPQYSDFPDLVDPGLKISLQRNGIEKLYSHQAICFEKVNNGKNVIIITGTSSGKTICYNLPVLNYLIANPEATALYLFPTKALAQDQKNAITSLIDNIPENSTSNTINKISASIYDGDTQGNHRALIRDSARIILSNPDMLHISILPHHTVWKRFLKNLKYIVLDEAHIYRGVFGSHVANLIRRLKRILLFYGSTPRYFLTSATIGNPIEFAEKFIEEKVEFVNDDGSPKGPRQFILYNPPIINSDLGIRKNTQSECVRLADDLLDYGVQILVFARTRRMVELLLINLRQKSNDGPQIIHGYRSGYLPRERREIEQAFKNGKARAVVATNALELGIDIGGVDAVILSGYPGSIAATFQQAGRSGRRRARALAILVASSSPLDQFIINHPAFLFDQSPEKALIDPDNILIAIQHIQCAIYELPFYNDEPFGRFSQELLKQILENLGEIGVIHAATDKYYWSSEEYPAQKTSLRNASADRISIRDVSDRRVKTIGEVDRSSACWMLHPQAIYIHDGETYRVEELLLEENIANLKQIDPEYFTIPKNETQIILLNLYQNEGVFGGEKYFGEVLQTTRVTGYKKISWYSHEKLSDHIILLPPSQLRTVAYWFCISEQVVDLLSADGHWLSSPNEYGQNWNNQRNLARKRDNYICCNCGLVEKQASHHVHHKTPFRQFESIEKANHLDNLITLCPACHRKAEAVVRMKSGLSGLAYELSYLAPLFLMCDFGDIGVYADPVSSLGNGLATIIFYDQTPGGIGLSQSLYQMHNELLLSAFKQIQECPCRDGCPGCVGPVGESGTGGKQETLLLLSLLYSGLEG